MANRIVLAWTVNVAGTSFGPTQAAAALQAVPLYSSGNADPVLGQFLGLTVAHDVTTIGAGSATRTLTLNMAVGAGSPFAPPVFPCHPDMVTPPVIPLRLRRSITLPGSFVLTNGSVVVPTSENQIPSLVPNDTIQFLAQLGVDYTVAGVSTTAITLLAPFAGRNVDSPAVKLAPAPITRAALYSTSPLDTGGFATTPAVPAGSGARTVRVTYFDSDGNGPFNVTTTLTGRRPAQIALVGGSIDIAVITDFRLMTLGGFANSVGQITISELSADVPAVNSNRTAQDFLGPLTDEAQLLLSNAIIYMPPSFFAVAQQEASTPELVGNFFVSTGSPSVPTTADQTAALAAGNTIEFAAQPGVDYTVQTVSAKIVTLTAQYTGLDNTATRDSNSNKRPTNTTALAQKQATGASRITPSPAASPTNDQLAAALAEFVNPGDAIPPPSPPLPPTTMSPAPTLLSGLFTRTLSLALAVPVIPSAITFI